MKFILAGFVLALAAIGWHLLDAQKTQLDKTGAALWDASLTKQTLGKLAKYKRERLWIISGCRFVKVDSDGDVYYVSMHRTEDQADSGWLGTGAMGFDGADKGGNLPDSLTIHQVMALVTQYEGTQEAGRERCRQGVK